MESKIEVNECKEKIEIFPAIFANKDRSIVVLAENRTGDKTFAGTVIHCPKDSKTYKLGNYSTGWTYIQFSRLPKGSTITLNLIQND